MSRLEPEQAIEIAIDALRDLDLVLTPPPGTSPRAATVQLAQQLIRTAYYKADKTLKETGK